MEKVEWTVKQARIELCAVEVTYTAHVAKVIANVSVKLHIIIKC